MSVPLLGVVKIMVRSVYASLITIMIQLRYCRISFAVIHNVKLTRNVYTLNIPEPTQNEIKDLAAFLKPRSKCLVITGAGCSTESGIPDYRGPNGSYKRGHKPIMHNDFVSSEHSRKRYWARSIPGWTSFVNAHPNNVHYTLANLEFKGIIKTIVTQNVDRLHQKAGSKYVFDLHGRNDRVSCLSCQYEMSRRIIQDQLSLMNTDFINNNMTKMSVENSINNINGDSGNRLRADGDTAVEIENFHDFQIPVCPKCNGNLKPTVVYFGDNVEQEKVKQIHQEVEDCDAMLIIGTSLEVYSAYRFVDKASKLGKPIAIINNGETRAERNNLPGIVYKSESLCSVLLQNVLTLLWHGMTSHHINS